MEEKRGSRRSLSTFSNPTLNSNLSPLAFGVVFLSAGAVSQTHPSEVVKTRQGRVRESTCGRCCGSERGNYAWLFLRSVLWLYGNSSESGVLFSRISAPQLVLCRHSAHQLAAVFVVDQTARRQHWKRKVEAQYSIYEICDLRGWGGRWKQLCSVYEA